METRQRCIDATGVDPNVAYDALMLDVKMNGPVSQTLLANIATVEPEELSSHQVISLRYAAHGYNNQQISDLQGVSLDTVKWNLKEANRKLGARDRTHAVVLCLLLGLFNEE